MKPYLNAKDVMAITGVGRNKAYQILEALRKKSIDGQEPWENSYECKYYGSRAVIPTAIFIKEFPHAKQAVKELE